MKRPVASLVPVVAMVLTLTVTSCGREGDRQSATKSEGPWSKTIDGLCTAADQARAGDTEAARTTFLDQSHDDLHRLADQATERDPIVAAVLLEAKERVEVGFEAGSPSLAGDLETLVDATRAAVRVIEEPVPPPCS